MRVQVLLEEDTLGHTTPPAHLWETQPGHVNSGFHFHFTDWNIYVSIYWYFLLIRYATSAIFGTLLDAVYPDELRTEKEFRQDQAHDKYFSSGRVKVAKGVKYMIQSQPLC